MICRCCKNVDNAIIVLNEENTNFCLSREQFSLLRQQLNVIPMIVLAGSKLRDILNLIPENVCVLEKESYSYTNDVRGIDLALKIANSAKNVLIMQGDCTIHSVVDFTRGFKSFLQVNKKRSSKVVSTTITHGKVERLGYGLTHPIWSKLVYLTGRELKICRKLVCQRENFNLFTWELINLIIDKGGQFIPVFDQ